MQWLDNMNRALSYVEEHLQDKMDYTLVAQAASCSVYQFQRIFSYITGIPLSEYVRRRKMTMAAFELQNSRIKVVDLALKYGYDSPEAFARAFQTLHGVAPTQARKSGVRIKAYPRLTFQITMKGDNEMNYKIMQKDSFQVYGLERVVDTTDGQNLKEIPSFWSELLSNGQYEKLYDSQNYTSNLNGICGYRPVEGSLFPYMICCLKTPLSDTEGYTVVDVPAATWAVFVNEPHTIQTVSDEVQALISRVYSDWLPTANYTIVEGFEMELYHSTPDGQCYEEAWFRVTPNV